MKRRCCYIESLFLTGIICLSACGSKSSGASKEELKKEFVKDRTQKDSPIEGSIPSESAEDYQASPGIKYQSRIMTEGAIALDIESALKNVHPSRLSDLGKEVSYKKMESQCNGSSLIRINDDFLVFVKDGLWLLDRDFGKKKVLVRLGLKVIHSGGGSVKVEGGYSLRDFYYDPTKGQLRFTCRNMKTGKAHLVVTSWAELLASPQPVELKSTRSKLPIDRNYPFSVPDGYRMRASCSDELYMMGLKGDTLCHFVLGDNGRYRARLFEVEGGIVYYYQGNTIFYHAYGGKVYRIKNASTLKVAYKLDFGSLPHLTGAWVAGGADVGNSYFLTSCVDTDRFLFLSLDKGYDSINARKNRSVKPYSLVYDKRSEEFFFLSMVSDKVNPEQSLIIVDLSESSPFQPNRNIEGNPAQLFSRSSLLELYPAQMRENGQMEKLNKTDNIWLITKQVNMMSHYLKVAPRLIKRSFLFSTTNMLGFALGMVAVFLIYPWVVDELTLEDYNPDVGRILRVIGANCTESGEIVENPFTTIPLVEALRKEFPQVEQVTYVRARELRSLYLKDRNLSVNMTCVDTTFSDMPPFKVAEGNPPKLKSGFNHTVPFEKMVRELFGTASAIGQQLIYTEGMDTEYSLTVVGVVKVLRKSHLQFGAVVGRALFDKMNENVCIYWSGTDWDRREANVYVGTRSGSSTSGANRNQMSCLLSNRVHVGCLLRFQPLNDIHLKTGFVDVSVRNHGSMTSIFPSIALVVLIAFMGAFDFTIFSTARVALHYKEIGVKKVIGAKRKTLIVQFLSEGLVQVFISLVLTLALTELLSPLSNQVTGKDITLQFSWSVLAHIVVGIVGVGCLSGSCSTSYLSATNPLMALKRGQKPGKEGGLICGLPCVQLVTTITLPLYTGTVFKQLNYLQGRDLGLSREDIVSVYTDLWYDVDGFRQEALGNPNILSVSMGAEIADYVEDSKGQGDVLQWTGAEGRVDSLRMVRIWADGNSVNTFGLKLPKGEILKADGGAYFSGVYNFPIIINEIAQKVMNMSGPVGMEISGGLGVGSPKEHTVGAVQDLNFQSLCEKTGPVYLIYSPECLVNVHIKISPEHEQETLAFTQKKFKETAPLSVKELKHQSFSDTLNRNYEKERQQGRMLSLFIVPAIVIVMMGVFGLVSFSIRQRTKETGIHKVNGAHSDQIVKMFCPEYLKWMGIVFVTACPSGYLLMYYWLSDFAYQIAISWWPFPLVGLIIVGITLFTVIGQTWRTVSQNPVKSLRYE